MQPPDGALSRRIEDLATVGESALRWADGGENTDLEVRRRWRTAWGCDADGVGDGADGSRREIFPVTPIPFGGCPKGGQAPANHITGKKTIHSALEPSCQGNRYVSDGLILELGVEFRTMLRIPQRLTSQNAKGL